MEVKTFNVPQKGIFKENFNGAFKEGREVKVVGESTGLYYVDTEDCKKPIPFDKKFIRLLGEDWRPIFEKALERKIREIYDSYENNGSVMCNALSSGNLVEVSRFVVIPYIDKGDDYEIGSKYGILSGSLSVGSQLVDYLCLNEFGERYRECNRGLIGIMLDKEVFMMINDGIVGVYDLRTVI